jgi:hypothetical protein
MFISAAIAYTLPHPQKSNNRLHLDNPFLIRLFVPTLTPLMADVHWLKNSSSELTIKKINTDNFYSFFDNLLLLDPYFIAPTRYCATYLASIKNRSDLVEQLLKHAYSLNGNIDLAKLALLLHISYAKKLHTLQIKNWLVILGKTHSPDPKLINTLIYARKNSDARFLKEDLLWLKKRTKNPAYLSEIDKALKAL